MASRPIALSRLSTLIELGEDRVFDAYLELGSVRGLMMELFQSHGGSSVGAESFYKWLDLDEGRRQRWEQLLQVQGVLDADEALEVARSATPADAHSKKLLVETLKWRSGKLNARYSDRTRLDVGVHLTTPQQWLSAISSRSELGEITDAEIVVEDEVIEPE